MTLGINDVRATSAAKRYYASSDYFVAGQELKLMASGKAADKLDLSGAITLPELESLFDKVHPRTGEKLYQRKVDNALAAKDFTFSPPKSVTIMAQVAGDERIFEAHERVVDRVMAMLEENAQVRVRKGMDNTSNLMRTVANMLWVNIVHPYPRPVGGWPDPGFHGHTLAFNLAHDPVEDKFKAAQLFEIKSAAPFWQAVYHNELANEMQELGYKTRATRDAFELSGVPMHVIATFSRRTDVINDPANLAKVKSPKGKAALAGFTREKRVTGLPDDAIYSRWMDRLTDSEKGMLTDTYHNTLDGRFSPKPDYDRHHLQNALQTLLRTESRVSEERLFTQALKQGVGEVTLDGLKAEIPNLPDVVHAGGMVSTDAALKAEAEVIDFARRGGIAWEKKKTPGLPDAAKLTFPALHAMVRKADAAGDTLHIAGDAKGLPAGHPLKVLREFTGVRPLGEEEARAKKTIVVSVPTPKLITGWGKAMQRHMGRVRKAIFWRQQEGAQREIRERQAAREGFER